MVVVILGWELAAVQAIRPGKTKFFQDGFASPLDGETHATARADGDVDLLRAHWHINRTKEELQLAGAAVLDERRESCQLQLGVRLQLVSHQVGHLGHVVAEVLAHGDADGVAAPLLLVPEAQCRPQEQEQLQQQQPQPDASRRPRDARPCAPPGHGQSRGQQRRGLLQQTPPVCTGAPVAALLPSSG